MTTNYLKTTDDPAVLFSRPSQYIFAPFACASKNSTFVRTGMKPLPASTCSSPGPLADKLGMGGPDYILDLSSSHRQPAGPGQPATGGTCRPWLAVHWRCCEAYSRIYRDPAATSYQGRCPSCGREINIAVGPGGTNCRFFDAY